MKFAVIVFPGSNCDADCYRASGEQAGYESQYVWHKDASLPADIDCVILPGGFSYGDYLRCGAIAKFSPVMGAVNKFAAKGRPVIGICNGFQILCEAGLLPGALLRNASMRFVCKDVYLKVERRAAPFTDFAKDNLKIPVAHGEGNYYIDPAGLQRLKDNNQIAFRYCDANGAITSAANPNGSLDNIAGIVNEAGNVLGMMPHPDRCTDPALGDNDGLLIWRSIAERSFVQA